MISQTEMIVALVGAIFGIIGVLVGVALSHRSVCIIERKKLTTDLFVIHNSADCVKTRNEASKVLKQNLNQGNDDSWEGLYKRLRTSEDWEKISQVDHFFRNIYFLSQNGLLDEKLTKTLFRNIHQSWFKNYFSFIDLASEKENVGTQSRLNQWLGET